MADIVFDYVPREQFKPLHQRTERWACMVCHRRAGKTVSSVNELILRALLTHKKHARFAYIAPFYRQAKDVAWSYLKEGCKEFAIKIREAVLRVELPNGAWITLYGADNPDALRGLYFDGVVLDEYGDARPSLWGQVVLPTLADRKGWALFIGTPKGKNHFYEIYQRSLRETGWFSLTLKASQSGILDPDELLAMKGQMSDSEFEQEMECNFTAALLGTYYAAHIAQLEIMGRIKARVVRYDQRYTVKLAADLGRSDNTAMWFWQETPLGIHVIDYYENQGKGIEHYIDHLRSLPYKYEEVWLPHDAVAKTLATKRSTIEQMLDAGFPCRKVPRLEVQHGIDAVRKVLPHCLIDAEKCFHGIEALRAYSRRYNELTKSFNPDPLHNWASDGCFHGITPVLTTRGAIPIASVLAGDRVILGGVTGLVTEVRCTGIKPIYEFEFEDGTFLRCTANHKIFTTRGLIAADSLRCGDTLYTNDEAHLWSASLHGTRKAFTESFSGLNTDTGRKENSLLASGEEKHGCYTAPGGLLQTGLFRAALRWFRLTGIMKILSLINAGKIKTSTKKTVNLAESCISPITQPAHDFVATTAKRVIGANYYGLRKAWDLTIEHHHAYVAGGCLVSNSDAFRYFSLVVKERVAMEPVPKQFTTDGPRLTTYTMNDLFAERERLRRAMGDR